MENNRCGFISRYCSQIILLLTFFPILGFSQNIDKTLKSEKWGINKSLNPYDVSLLRVRGDNNENGVTNVGLEFDKKHIGFTVHLYVTRMNQHFVNLKNFTFIVKDSCGTEVLRDTLGFKSGVEMKKEEMYWNYGYLSSTINVRNVSIYLYDKISLDGNGEFIFQTIK
jgi:hypothetical protein